MSRTVRDEMNDFLARSNGDQLSALRLACEHIATVANCVSAGYVRASPRAKVEATEAPPSIDDPDPSPAFAAPHA
ncbi:MAG: hypothetical protein KGL39_57695 [Patescibacteria group bacterium]|nr:hypothetical protein [Patescibacteria group bacterium]